MNEQSSPANEEKSPSDSENPKTSMKIYISSREKIIDFVVGFVGWYVINSVLWMIERLIDSIDFFMEFSLIFLILNFWALIYLFINRRWMSVGIIVAYIINIFLMLNFGMENCYDCWYEGIGMLVGLPYPALLISRLLFW